MNPEVYLWVCPLVFLAGFIDSMAGGGGLISLPAYLIAGVPLHNALATNKLSSFLGTLASTFRFWKNRCVDLTFILPSVGTTLVGSMIGARLALLANAAMMERLLLVVLPVTAYYVFKNKRLDEAKINSLPRRRAMFYAALISLVIGTYDGFYGPGTGTFLIVLYTAVCKIDVRTAAGNAKLVNLSSNFSALLMFILNGAVWYQLGLVAAIFGIAGNYLGAGLAIDRGYRIVRPIVLTVLGLLFIRIVVF